MITYLRRRTIYSNIGSTDINWNNEYLTFEVIDPNGASFKFSNPSEYSVNKSAWTSLAMSTATPTFSEGDIIRWRGNVSSSTYGNGIGKFTATGLFNAMGNPLSLTYGNNFKGITTIPYNQYCMKGMFSGNNYLVNAKDLKLVCTTLKNACYMDMFLNCKSLISTPELPATTLASDCYQQMFRGCSALTSENLPELPATTLTEKCYNSMFYGCYKIKTAPELPATSLAPYCYNGMFRGCKNLIFAPELPATTLATNCYADMFYECFALTYGPELHATTLVDSCYNRMFYGCKRLTYLICDATNINNSTTYTGDWMYAANSSYGMIFVNTSADWTQGASGLPSGWTVNPTKSTPSGVPISNSPAYYVTFTCASAEAAIKLNTCYTQQALYISNDAQNWYNLTSTSTYYSFNKGEKLYLAGYLSSAPTSATQCIGLSIYGTMEMSGNINALWSCNDLTASLKNYCGYRLFKNGNVQTGFGILTAPTLPSTVLSDSCYREMFEGAILQSAPELLATTLAESCYRSMFNDCICLVSVSELPAITLANYCYSYMFQGCTSLTAAPVLPATTLANYCYKNMFKGCTSLTAAPALPATTLATQCYYEIFRGCTSLTTAPELLATMVYHECYSGMFRDCSYLNYVKCMYNEVNSGATTWRDNMLTGVAATGTLVKEINTDWSEYVPSGWTVTNEGVLKPTISFDGEDIILDCQTSGATIYYQLNNTGNFIAYTGVITISSDTVIKTYAELNGVTSPIVSSICIYVPTSLVDPTIEFNYGTTITISCLTPNSTIYYRLNNTGSFVQYTEPIIINSTTTIEAYSELDGSVSNTVSETFTFIDYDQQYFTIESLADNNTISIVKVKSPSNINLSYSTNDGATWTDLTISATTTIATINTSDRIIFKGVNSRLATAWDTYYRFNGSKNFNVYGNIMSLLNGDNFVNTTELNSSTDNHFAGLFYGTTTLVNANKLYLSASTLYYNSYNGMFRGCTNLVSAPQIQATTPGQECCSSMFEGCINLEVAPELNFTTLAQGCCKRMFCMNRSSKITTPKMTKSPILRCATGASGCYDEMFKGNGNLIEVTCLMTSGFQCSNWVQNISSSGTFKKASGASWSTGTSGIPSGWTVVDYVE